MRYSMARHVRGSVTTAGDPRMELVPVGVGAAYGLPHEGQSSYLVRTPERAVVLDLGSGTFNRLCALVAPQDLDAVVISHLHPDHCADLMSLRVYMLWGPGAGGRLRLMGPSGLRERLTAFSGSEGWDEAFAFEELSRPGGRADLRPPAMVRGWGRATGSHSRVTHPGGDAGWREQLAAAGPRGLIARGGGCGYGDAAQNAGGIVATPHAIRSPWTTARSSSMPGCRSALWYGRWRRWAGRFRWCRAPDGSPSAARSPPTCTARTTSGRGHSARTCGRCPC